MNVPERLAALRSLMRQKGIDAYMVPTDDYHSSEYVGEFFKCRKYLTGFTGSAGTAVVTADFAGLWTDGRYFIQAADQLAGSGFTLMRMGQEGVPTIEEYLEEHLNEGQTLGFDGRTVTAAKGAQLAEMLGKKQVRIDSSLDLVGEIWEERPALSCEKVWELNTVYAGKSRMDKLREMRRAMAQCKATYLLLTSLEDIAWLLNIRGNDVECTPVVLSYLVLTQSKVRLFAQREAFDEDLLSGLEKDGVELLPYDGIYEFVTRLPKRHSLWMDPAKANYTLRKAVPEEVEVICRTSPTILAKACKNSIEVANMKKAHIRDGVAVTRFICWLKKAVREETVTELSAIEKLEQLRQEGKNYLGPSFHYIIAYGEHAAICHYSPSEESNVTIQPRGLALADTGGHYLEGTTDITRTIAVGELTQEEKEYFTRVLRGNLNLAAAKFLYGCTGQNLDPIARQPLWEIGEDYNHGTGHGVGYLLGVHEGPNSIRWRSNPDGSASAVFEEGMITSDEPGYYREGAFGIRHENMMVCHKAEKTDAGQFMEFETLTLVPFDLEGVLPEMMTERERALLNAYHEKVYEKIAPHLNEEERAWLKEATRAI